MQVYFDWVVLFQVFCIVQGFTTGIYLLTTKKQQPSHYWLGWLLLGLTLQITDYFLSRSGIYYRNRWLYFSPFFFSWSFGPLIYFYVKSRVQKINRISYWHFVPVMVQGIFYLLLVFQPLSVKADFWISVHKPYTRYLEHYGACLSVLCYGISSITFGGISKERDSRHYYFLCGLILFYIVAAIDPLFNHLYLEPTAPKFYLTALVLPLFMYSLALYGLLRKPTILIRKKAANSSVDKDKLDQVIKVMHEAKLYKNPDLSLPILAQQIGLPTNELSRIINSGLQKTFADFVNDFRIAEVKERMLKAEDERFSLLGLALDAGFSSKTTFNRVFKERTGMAPKFFKKESQLINRGEALPNES
ncbi:helix-turn-helix domain-containing protein [Adhaeribacter pallidiroseus]|uniref:HTH araC/xylS-type domain-containing protein n=1 Tax=Adhaeribacter pallidiroseus TaxID=2072847 RepID=A0A369QPR9_9BACT|nr:helix-turn-helix domain-containing protein [Adhaeribacter pallidiroseus]RDC65665.1 hypothetical protein AHMF7616_04295 [Adhaeribacter pallidiroseus]